VHLLGAQEPGRVIVFAKHAGSYEQRSQVFLHHPALPIQVCQESPQTISIDAACRATNLDSARKRSRSSIFTPARQCGVFQGRRGKTSEHFLCF